MSCVTELFRNRTKKYEDIVEKSRPEKKISGKKICRYVFVFLCQTSYCPNLRANKRIPFDLQLSKGTQKTFEAHI